MKFIWKIIPHKHIYRLDADYTEVMLRTYRD